MKKPNVDLELWFLSFLAACGILLVVGTTFLVWREILALIFS